MTNSTAKKPAVKTDSEHLFIPSQQCVADLTEKFVRDNPQFIKDEMAIEKSHAKGRNPFSTAKKDFISQDEMKEFQKAIENYRKKSKPYNEFMVNLEECYNSGQANLKPSASIPSSSSGVTVRR